MKFIIISPSRSGSTSLRLTLNSHPQCLCHGEILGPNKINGISHKIVPPDINTNYRDYNLQGPLGKFFPDNYYQEGFKALYSHFFPPKHLKYFNHFLNNDASIIFLWRQDLVARYQSELLFKIRSGHISPKSIKILTSSKVIDNCHTQILMANFILKHLTHYPKCKVMQLNFEDLIRNKNQPSSVFDFLGLPQDANDSLLKDKNTSNKKKDKFDHLIEDKLSSMSNLEKYRYYKLDNLCSENLNIN